MKQIIIFILLASNIYSQTWEYEHPKSGLREIVSFSSEFVKGEIFTLSKKYYESTDPELGIWSKSFIRVHSISDGDIIDSTQYQIDTLLSSLSWAFYNRSKGEYYIAGEAHSNNLPDRRGYFLLTKWNSDLDFISDTLVRLEPYDEYNAIWYLVGNQTKEDEYLVIGYQNDDPERLYINIDEFIVKINENGNIDIIRWFDKTQTTANQSNVFYDDIINTYVIISLDAYYLNDNLDIIKTFNTDDLSDYYNGIVGLANKFSDDKYLATVRYYNGQNHGLAFFDRNFNYIKGINFSKSKYGIQDLSIARKNYDYIDTSVIYAGNYEFYKSHITVAKLNSNLDPYWIKYYSYGDSIFHYVWSLTATTDGGFVLTGGIGQQEHEGIFPEEFNGWVKKFDSEGNTVSTLDPNKNEWSITVYPNPSPGEFKINIEGINKQTQLKLFDIQGREVKNYDKLTAGVNNLNMYDISSGMYIWHLEKEGKVIGTGRWVKE